MHGGRVFSSAFFMGKEKPPGMPAVGVVVWRFKELNRWVVFVAVAPQPVRYRPRS